MEPKCLLLNNWIILFSYNFPVMHISFQKQIIPVRETHMGERHDSVIMFASLRSTLLPLGKILAVPL